MRDGYREENDIKPDDTEIFMWSKILNEQEKTIAMSLFVLPHHNVRNSAKF